MGMMRYVEDLLQTSTKDDLAGISQPQQTKIKIHNVLKSVGHTLDLRALQNFLCITLRT